MAELATSPDSASVKGPESIAPAVSTPTINGTEAALQGGGALATLVKRGTAPVLPDGINTNLAEAINTIPLTPEDRFAQQQKEAHFLGEKLRTDPDNWRTSEGRARLVQNSLNHEYRVKDAQGKDVDRVITQKDIDAALSAGLVPDTDNYLFKDGTVDETRYNQAVFEAAGKLLPEQYRSQAGPEPLQPGPEDQDALRNDEGVNPVEAENAALRQEVAEMKGRLSSLEQNNQRLEKMFTELMPKIQEMLTMLKEKHSKLTAEEQAENNVMMTVLKFMLTIGIAFGGAIFTAGETAAPGAPQGQR